MVSVPAAGLCTRGRIRILEDGAAANRRNRGLPQICPSIPGRLFRPGQGQADRVVVAACYLTSMGPLYRQTLRRLGHGPAADDILSANPTHRTAEVRKSAEVLLDELTVWGDDTAARECLNRWSPPARSYPS